MIPFALEALTDLTRTLTLTLTLTLALTLGPPLILALPQTLNPKP